MSSTQTSYLSHIDGLRAFAVIPVLLFHAGFATFEGGFVGVDIFFVISGFLITRSIVTDTQQGGFSFVDFYLRRARRLFPAFFATLVLTFMFGFLLLSPEHLERLGQSTMYAVLAISNFFFWGESGYFDTDAALKPLLHTWSLSVEEQFYAFWPALLLLILKIRRPIITGLVLLAAIILPTIAAQVWLQRDASAAFFLLPFRIAEFAIGATLVWITHRPAKWWARELLALVGLGLIAYSIFTFSEGTLFPGLSSLIPCLGAALLIYSGDGRFSGRLLGNGIARFVGRVSYSLYLLHWPVFVYFGYWKGSQATMPEALALLALTLAAAAIMHRYVEQPFRHANEARRPEVFGVGCLALATILSFTTAHAWANSGWVWRISESKQKLLAGIESPYDCGNMCSANDAEVTFIGDSHIQHLGFGLSEFSRETGMPIRMMGSSACLMLSGVQTFHADADYKKDCDELKSHYWSEIDDKQNSIIVLGHRWTRYADYLIDSQGDRLKLSHPEYAAHIVPELEHLVSNYTGRGLVLLGSFPEMSFNMKECELKPQFIPSADGGCSDPSADVYRRTAIIDGALKELSMKHENVFYVDPKSWLCDEVRCANVRGGKLITSDGHHLTAAGSAYIAPRIMSSILSRRDGNEITAIH